MVQGSSLLPFNSHGRYQHREHIQSRLGFLHYVLLSSSLTLTATQLDLLWECLAEKSAEQEREMFFKWLEDSSPMSSSVSSSSGSFLGSSSDSNKKPTVMSCCLLVKNDIGSCSRIVLTGAVVLWS